MKIMNWFGRVSIAKSEGNNKIIKLLYLIFSVEP
jgi:hypothetical protein